MEALIKQIESEIRDVPDFPKEGIIFKDITPLFKNPKLIKEMVAYLKMQYKDAPIDAIAGIESRGFLLGVPLALALNVPFILIRKKGKLPCKTIAHSYQLEYGEATIEVHEDAIEPGQNVLIHDDLIATGGSASAAAELIKKLKGNVYGFNFLIELSFLNGEENLRDYSKNITSFVTY
ncbi:adenine phosphoribosyltransferase [Putridiphycobacter roseus]|uniref:Adenine phosphoribosyltransferase n=1 Tax=Putridiphycobacter roseus TaxID=2219161 RepID=A0A2W1MXQ9_9FLAO|nr:adenine phosphoribosyltransferase [Putridiphycobacter roseus]PZE16939.1 adenine phosphoribosyltransferase [Putridiphycobacter roseus]